MINFEKIAEEWLIYVKNRIKISTYACYVRLLRTHILPYFKNYEITSIDQIAISQFIEKKRQNGRIDDKGGLSEKTIKDIVSVIKNILKYGEIVYDMKLPGFYRNNFRNTANSVEVFTEEEQNILEKYIIHHMDPAMLGIMVCLQCGLRLGEICALKWENIDFDKKILSVRNTVQRIYMPEDSKHTKILFGTPKTRASIRDIPVNSFLINYFLKYKKSGEYYVLSENSKKFMDPRSYQRKYKKILDDIGLIYRNFHCLRHTFATRCMEKGIDVKSLSELLGHSNVNITLNCYIHSSLEYKRKALEKIIPNIKLD